MIPKIGVLAIALVAGSSLAPAPYVAPYVALVQTAPQEAPGQMAFVREGSRILMPLERTSVKADVAGMGARVTVVQTFTNPSPTPIEAVYTFPLPADAAVDRMRIKIGSRVIEGDVMRRDDARKTYEAAKASGRTAALLDGETDNVFTQSVANILPGARVEVEISYVQLLKFEDGEFEFGFPMVVAPRYLGAGTKDPQKLNPPTLPNGVRSGQNIDLLVTLHGGAPIREFRSVLHAVETKRVDPKTVQVGLSRRDEIPNRDFILRYRTAQNEVQESLLTTWDDARGGHFALVLAPPPKPTEAQRAPKEMIFVIDQSGSQSGFPIDKSKELSLALLDTMGPRDLFNVMGFSNEVNPLWPGPRMNTPENLDAARRFIRSLNANGGTELEKAVVASLSTPNTPGRVRVVLFNTDGLAGQESVILKNVQTYRGGSRLFTFGIGNSVNRALIDAMSLEGRGASEIVTLAESADAAVARFARRIDRPLLVNLTAKFVGGAVEGVTPEHLPDVFSAKPVIVTGRYTRPGRTKLVLTGLAGGRPWRRELDVDLPRGVGDGSAIASLWARTRIAELKSRSYTSRAFGKEDDITEAITKLALSYRLVSEHTSFVAVDRTVANGTGQITTVRVPVDAPDGMSVGMGRVKSKVSNPSPGSSASQGGFGGGGGGMGGGVTGAAPSLRSGQGQIPKSVEYISYDPTDNSLIVRGGGDKANLGTIASPAKREVEVESGLLGTKGAFNVRVVIAAVSKYRLELLRKAGLKVESHDGATQVFGVADAKTLPKLIKLDFVLRISRLRSE